jgi:two-component system, LytTR family, sensor kinase
MQRPSQPWPWIAAALAGGLAVGWLDRSATEVQGPLLLLMTIAFFAAIPRQAPAWAVALAATSGLPLAHVLGRTLGDPAGASWGMLIPAIPATIAAYVGYGVGVSTRNASGLVDRRVLIGAMLIACAVAGTGPVYATLVARGQPFAWFVTTIWQLGTLVAWSIATPFLIRTWQRSLVATADGWSRELTRHILVILAIAVAHALLLPLVTRGLLIPLGRTTLASTVGWSLVAYVPLDALAYVAIWGAVYLSDADRRAHDAAIREGAARGELAVARLAGLRAQLRPHFLFNALNTASMLAARGDTDGTRRVLTGLGDLLRYVMRGADQADAKDAGIVAVREEIAFVEQYLAIESERFAERLRVSIDVAEDVQAAAVPALLLQPLVENAIVHGVGARIGAGAVSIRCWRDGETLRLAVQDDGPGPTAPNDDGTGIGLSNTRARLAVLYGSAAAVTLEPVAGGGARATVSLPIRMIR